MLNIKLTSSQITPNFEEALKSIIEIAFSSITNNDIETMKGRLSKSFINQETINFNVLDFKGIVITLQSSQIRTSAYSDLIDVYFPKEPKYDEYTEFSFLRDGAKEVVEIVKQLRIRDLALLSFMVEGRVMPVGKFDSTVLQFCIHFGLNSTTFSVEYDRLAFDRFVVVA